MHFVQVTLSLANSLQLSLFPGVSIVELSAWDGLTIMMPVWLLEGLVVFVFELVPWLLLLEPGGEHTPFLVRLYPCAHYKQVFDELLQFLHPNWDFTHNPVEPRTKSFTHLAQVPLTDE